MSKTIIYLMHISWNWIKQRPQYIAEGLSKKYKVEVFYKLPFRQNDYQKENKIKNKNLNLNPIVSFPGSFEKYKIIEEINEEIFKKKVASKIKKTQADIIYITFPTFLKYIPKDFRGKVIYDCMDNYVAMEKVPSKIAEIEKNEKSLISRANNIIFSSNYLMQVIEKRYGTIQNKKVIRNGFNSNNTLAKRNYISSSKLKLSYFGTVSTWFDFSLLQESLEKFPNLYYEIIGPIDKSVALPKDSRIKCIGTVEHNDLYKYVHDSMALIMPFKVNDIIKSVDPVKLYEYINFDKNIITIEYPEIERFKNFVYFYKNYDEYIRQIQKVLSDSDVKYSFNERKEFLRENSWNSRVNKIMSLLKE